MIHVSLPRPPRLDSGPRKVRIERCTNNGAWYAARIGQVVPIESIDDEGYWGREGGTFNCINVIRKCDATLLPLEN